MESSSEILARIAAEQGWNAESQRDLCIGFIDQRGLREKFANFLQDHADHENDNLGITC